MKTLKYIFIATLAAIVLWACEKDEAKVTVSSNPTPPVFIKPINGDSIFLKATEETSKITFIWKAADYGIQVVPNCFVQVDTLNGNFVLPTKLTVAITYKDTLTLTNKELNNVVLRYTKLNVKETHNLDIKMRVLSVLGKDSILSSPITINVTTY